MGNNLSNQGGINVGKYVAVAGKGGVGKTTFMTLMLRQMVREKTGISILAVDADPNANLNEALGLTVTTTISDHLEEIKNLKTIPDEMRATLNIKDKFQQIVDFSELQEFLDVPVKNFSSGMTARLAFAIATIVDPEVLIVDEILSVGDINFQEKSKNKMLELIKGGTTVLYVSHSLDSIKSICTKAVWLEQGHVRKIGDPKEICDAYYKSQMGE